MTRVRALRARVWVEVKALLAEEGCAPGQAGEGPLQDSVLASRPISFGSPRLGGFVASGRRDPELEEQIHALCAVQLLLNS